MAVFEWVTQITTLFLDLFFGGVIGPYLQPIGGPSAHTFPPLSHYESFRDIGQQKGDLFRQLLALLGEKIR